MTEKTRKTPQQYRARLTVQCILEAASQLLNRTWSTQVTTNDIAERAGVSVGTLYRYFGCKEEIFDAVTLEILQATANECHATINNTRIRSGDELVENLVDVALGMHDDELFLRQRLLRMLSARPSVSDAVHRERHKVVVALGQRLSGLEPERFRTLDDADLRSISAIWRGMVLSLSEDDPQHLSRARIKQLLIQTVIGAYSAEARPDRSSEYEAAPAAPLTGSDT